MRSRTKYADDSPGDKIKVDSPLGKLLATKGITPENSNQFEGTADW